jgi:hypothetical protein
LVGHAWVGFIGFTFGGEDENEEAVGEATLEGERLIFEPWHYRRDEYAFHCERQE